MSDMSAIDAAWLRMDRPTNLAIITSVLWFARPPDWEAVEELLRERLSSASRASASVAVEPRIPIGMPRWRTIPASTCGDTYIATRLAAPGDQAALEAFVRSCSPLHSVATSRCGARTSSMASATAPRSSGGSSTASSMGSRSRACSCRSATTRRRRHRAGRAAASAPGFPAARAYGRR